MRATDTGSCGYVFGTPLRGALGDTVEAARLLGAVAAHRDRVGLRLVLDGEHLGTSLAAARAESALGSDAYTQAWEQGYGLNIQDAIAYARRGRGTRGRPASGWRSLTPTEQRVVELIAEGLPNKDIAERLFVSVRTVTTHLSHIYSKLGITTRTELVAVASRKAASTSAPGGSSD